LIGLVLAGVLTFMPSVAAQPADGGITVVDAGRSDFVIYHAPDAPTSVVQAAGELQHYLERATGARLEIVTEPRAPMICLGDNDAAQAAGLSADGIALEGFRTVTRAGSIYILGPDTVDDEQTPGGGSSPGTRNGVYDFLERFVGVRWLMPGEHGDYVPRAETLLIPATDLTDAPFFENRRLPYAVTGEQQRALWGVRQRLGWSLYLYHAHSWDKHVGPDLFADHPDWFALNDGVRVPPTGAFKLCVTNPELNRYIADRAIAIFDRRPDVTCLSISPADGGGWCECPNCSALYETAPDGSPSITPAILHQYNEIARMVGERHPDRFLAGYVYDDYIWPPSEPVELEPNLFLVLAASNVYCYKLYRDDFRAEWEAIARGWAALTDDIAYYDIPVSLLAEAGAPNPVGRPILKFLYPRLAELGFRGVYIYGIAAWGHGAPGNYLMAKLAWDPYADVDALNADFFACAYAEGGDEIQRAYDMLDEAMEHHFVEHGGARVPDLGMLRNVYAPLFPEIERLYREARAQITDPDARVRLEMLGDNLTLLYFTLRSAGLADAETPSIFRASDERVLGLMDAGGESLAVAMEKVRVPPADRVRPVQVEPAVITAGPRPKFYKLRGDHHLVLAQSGDGPIEIAFGHVDTRGKLVTCFVFDAAGELMQRSLMHTDEPLRIDGAPGEHYHLVIMGGHASYHPTITGADWAIDATTHPRGLHFLQHAPPCWVYVPEGTEAFTLNLLSSAPGETAAATVTDPAGEVRAQLRTVETSLDLQRLDLAPGEAGWWCIQPGPADVGFFDDAYAGVGDEVPQFFALDPEHALIVTPAL